MAWAFGGFALSGSASRLGLLMRTGFTWASPYTLTPGTTNARVRLPFHVTPSLT